MVRRARSRRGTSGPGADEPKLTYLFVHGWQADRSVWGGVIAALGPVRCVDVDLRGSGELKDVHGPYTLEQFAADLRELIEGLDEGPVVVIGHSMGATVALRLAVDAPHLVRGLVLVAPVPPSGAALTEKGAGYLRATVGDAGAARKWLAKTFLREPPDETLDRLTLAAARTSHEAALQSFESWTGARFAEAAKKITTPAIVVAPEHDNPRLYEEKVASVLPNARFVVLTDSAHYAILEKPREIAEIIRRFVDGEVKA